MVAACGASLSYLEYKASRTDALPILQYEQPVWSEDESRVAYFRLLLPSEGGPYTCRQLWWAERVGQEKRLVAEFPPGELTMIAWIENDNGKAYVEDRWGNRSDVGVVTPTRGEKYLRTHADGVWTNNLLSLPRR